MKASDFFSLPASLAAFAPYFRPDVPPWEWLRAIADAIAGARGKGQGASDIFIHPSAKVAKSATIVGPAWIGPDTDIRPNAFIRENVIVGAGCVLGNSCEFKNALLMDKVQVPHFSYVGDSILGNNAHLGAGVICSNLRLDQKPIVVKSGDKEFATGLRKFGAIVGDSAEVGCNAVLNPGVLLGKRSLVAPLMAFSGHLPEGMIAKSRQTIITVART